MCGVYFRRCRFKSCGIDHREIDIQALDKLSHRGPDDSVLISENLNSLGFKRLSIRSIKSGSQPHFFGDGRFVGVINGELYNEQWVRDWLSTHHPDIELPPGDMQVLGVFIAVTDGSILNEVLGMFAGYVMDYERNLLYLFRDRVGEKPLYYSMDEDHLFVASELSPICENLDNWRIDLDARSLLRGFWPAPSTPYQGVNQVLPGQVLTIDLSQMKAVSQIYWDWTAAAPSRGTTSNERFAREFEGTLLAVVEEQLASEVDPVMFLSGGLDSALVLAAANQVSIKPLPALTLSFQNAEFDESLLAGQTAKALGSEHLLLRLTDAQLAAQVPSVISSMDFPIFDPACLGVFALSNFAKENGYKVALSGDGGDELLRGYKLFSYLPILRILSRVPNIEDVSSILAKLIMRMPKSNRYLGLSTLASRASEVFNHSAIPFEEVALSPFSGTAIFELIANQMADPQKNLDQNSVGGDRFSQAALESYYRDRVLPEIYLVKADRMSMSQGVEVRNPLLDSRLIELCNSISKKQIGKESKRVIFSEILKDKIGSSVLSAPKHGFSIPLSGVLRNLEVPTWKLDSAGISPEDAGFVWSQAVNGGQRYAHCAWSLFVLNSFL